MSQDGRPPDLATRTEGDSEGLTLGMPEGLSSFAPGQEQGERYQILEMLGRGGMGEVWHAYDLKLRVEVALKALREDLFKSADRLELLRREVRAAREVMSPNVCRIFDLVEIEGRELVSMEYVDGATLLAVLQERGPLELKEAQDIASQFLAGLEAIHQAGLVHRDIKPENIMLTRAGRVVVMDFGLARQEAEGGGSVSGTPAYMSPEQADGLTLDARADVYSAGVVLAEMVSPAGIRSFESRQSVWEGVRSEPAQVPDSPWAPVLRRAVAKDRERRYHTAHTLTRALEDVTLRVEGAEDIYPYPGLASFTEDDAEYFFGREAEVEQMWRKLDRPHLLALVGPSGAGKTSFLRAGLIPSAGPGWGILRCTPGSTPFLSVGRLLADEMASDGEAMETLAREGHQPDTLVDVFSRWREHHDHGLFIVDQFEELFTHSTADEQSKFTELMKRLAIEADVFVLLSMRDDFLLRCREHEALAPVFTELTALLPPTGGALRRAVVQPATKCGYRFEDDELVQEILGEVEGERGALPMLAFALERLWENRDRETGLLTREAYHDIGGVGGALARHAESTIDNIGTERIAVVRELFRNLVTAEGTRAVRTWGELLSVFEQANRESAEHVLHQLIDARLLTSYEVREDEHEPTRRVEIIHESLLANWPRLVRWQAQDVDGARLRDDLRQAARRWDERGRPDDLLWAGTAFREYRLWRERYPGGLTELEEAFATAMTALSTRRRRRRRMAAVASVAALVVVLAVVTTLWIQAVQATRRAEAAADRAEAARLVTLGRVVLEQDCTAALAYAIAGLERADTAAARRLAVRALWAGPPATLVHEWGSWEVAFSPDGRWLASGHLDGEVLASPSDGGAPIEVQGPAEDQEFVWSLSFSPDGRLLVGGAVGAGGQVRVWETEGWTLQRELLTPELVASPPEIRERSLAYGVVEPDRPSLVTVTLVAGGGPWTNPDVTGRWVVRRWPLAGGPSELVGEVPGSYNNIAVVDLSRRLLVAGIGSDLYLHDLDRLGQEPGRVVARHPGAFGWYGVALHPTEQRLAACDSSRTLRVWSLEGDGTEPRRELELANWPWGTTFSPDGRWLAQGTEQRSLGAMWDMQGPAFNEPLYLGGRSRASSQAMAFSPDGRWVAGTNTNSEYRRNGVTIWPVDDRYPRVLRLADGVLPSEWRDNLFHPDGSRVFTVATGKDGRDTLLSYPLSGGAGVAPTVVFRDQDLSAYTVDPMGRFLIVVSASGARKLPLSGGPATMLEGLGRVEFLSLDPTGRYLASGSHDAVLVLDLESGERHEIEPPGEGAVRRHSWRFDSVGRLLVTRGGVVSRWDPTTRASEVVVGEGVYLAAPFPDGDRLVLWSDEGDGQAVVSVLDLGSGSRTEVPRAHQGWILGHWDPTGSVWVSTHAEGEIRVGSLTDEEPHLLLSHETLVTFARVSPDGRWILTRGDNLLRLWPMPDVTKPPLHTLPYDDLMARLRALTNVRAIPDPESPNGYVLDPDFTAYRGWAEVPTW